jgi:hypothetical protein
MLSFSILSELCLVRIWLRGPCTSRDCLHLLPAHAVFGEGGIECQCWRGGVLLLAGLGGEDTMSNLNYLG